MRMWIPMNLDFTTASQLCDLSLNGILADFTSMADIQLATMVWQNKSFMATAETIWMPYRRNESGNEFYNIYTDQPFTASLWSTGQPGLYQYCVVCDLKGCQTEDCWSKQSFFCSLDQWPVVANVRGLCINTALGLSYYSDIKLGSFVWLNIEGAYIMYNSRAHMWKIAKAELEVRAESPALYASFLLGNHHWTFWNDFNCYEGKQVEVSVSLAICSENYFNCDCGGCTKLRYKCDGQNDCPDGSDELYCKVVEVPSNYKKQYSPFYWSKDKVNVTFEIIDVLDINEKEGKMRVKFRLGAAWYDFRLNYLDLWSAFTMNTLSEPEFDAIWRPLIEFENAELKHFEYNIKPEISVVSNISDRKLLPKASPSQLYKAIIFIGAYNSLFLRTLIRFGTLLYIIIFQVIIY